MCTDTHTHTLTCIQTNRHKSDTTLERVIINHSEAALVNTNDTDSLRCIYNDAQQRAEGSERERETLLTSSCFLPHSPRIANQAMDCQFRGPGSMSQSSVRPIDFPQLPDITATVHQQKHFVLFPNNQIEGAPLPRQCRYSA